MPAGAINLHELGEHTTMALAAGNRIAVPAGTGAEALAGGLAGRDRLLKLLAQSLWKFVEPYWAVLSIAERAIDAGGFDQEVFQNLNDRLLTLEKMADDVLASAGESDYLNRTLTAAPLVSLKACNERVKDCMVAIESMLDPHLDDLMAAALEEHQRGETVPLDSIL